MKSECDLPSLEDGDSASHEENYVVKNEEDQLSQGDTAES